LEFSPGEIELKIPMSALSLSLIAFVCIFGAALLGAYLRTVLPMHHLSTETKETVRLSMGVIGTMAALVLGLLIASKDFV
jgi:hypothetical protein